MIDGKLNFPREDFMRDGHECRQEQTAPYSPGKPLGRWRWVVTKLFGRDSKVIYPHFPPGA